MIVIPVIDLLHGHAVLARQGRRDSYLPLDTPWCKAGDVLSLIGHLHDSFGFNRVYIADIDAICGTRSNADLLARIRRDFPEIELWVDAGFGDIDAVEKHCIFGSIRPVVGSESWRSPTAPPGDAILSVDIGPEGLRDPSGVTSDPFRRPRRLILMNLQRVGSGSGPDLNLLGNWQRDAPGSEIYLAGGIRDVHDLRLVETAGAAGVLLASAIHNGSLSPGDVSHFR